MEKTIQIDGKEVKLKSSAAIPSMYRNEFGKDVFKEAHTGVDGSLIIDYAEEIGMGIQEYELINVHTGRNIF